MNRKKKRPMKRKGETPRKYTQAERTAVINSFKNNPSANTDKEIADRLGLPKSWVSFVLRGYTKKMHTPKSWKSKY